MVSRKTGQATRKLRPWTAKQPAVRIDGAGRLPEEWQRYDRSPVHPRPSAPGRLSPGLNGCALTAWLFERVDRPANAPPSPPSSIYNYQAVDSRDNSVQVFYLTHVPTTTDFQKIATQVRMDTNIRRVYTYIAPRVLLLRGTADQLPQAERILKQLDPADFPAD